MGWGLLPWGPASCSAGVYVPNSNILPASGLVGDVYVKNDATSGQRIYLCETPNTWVQQGGGGGGSSPWLHVDATSFTSVTSDNSDEVLHSYTVPGATLSASHRGLKGRVGFLGAASGVSRAMKLKIGGVTVSTFAASTQLNAKAVFIDFTLVRIGAASQAVICTEIFDDSTFAAGAPATFNATSLDESATIAIEAVSSSATAGSVTYKMMIVELID